MLCRRLGGGVGHDMAKCKDAGLILPLGVQALHSATLHLSALLMRHK